MVARISMEFTVTHYCHTRWDARVYWLKAVSRRAVPGAETGSKSEPCASNSPWQYHSKREPTKDHTGGEKVLREEEHSYWNKDLDQKLVGEGSKGEAEQIQWDNLRCKDGERERKHRARGKRRSSGIAGKKMTSLRNPRGGSEEGAVAPDKEGNTREDLKLKSRKSQEEGRESSWNQIRSLKNKIEKAEVRQEPCRKIVCYLVRWLSWSAAHICAVKDQPHLQRQSKGLDQSGKRTLERENQKSLACLIHWKYVWLFSKNSSEGKE